MSANPRDWHLIFPDGGILEFPGYPNDTVTIEAT